MDKKPQTPHAFPMENPEQGGNDGMTLRDYFAGQALVGMGQWTPIKDDTDFGSNPSPAFKLKAEWAYKMADAMLEERSKL